MRATALHTICIMTVTSILAVGFDAAAFDPNMEAQASCVEADCMLPVAPTVASQQALDLKAMNLNGEVMKLQKINRFATNEDKVIDRKLNPQFAPLGMVQRMRELKADVEARMSNRAADSKAGRATAFNMGPCTVVTNFHVVYGNDPYANMNADNRLNFSVGAADGKAFAESSIVQPADKGALTEDGQNDWAVTKDPKCLGKKYGWFNYTQKTNAELVNANAQVFLVSFPGDRNVGELSISVGRVTGVNARSGNLRYDVSEAPGSSGGAVFIFENGEMKLVGLNVGGMKDGDNYHFEQYSNERANEFKNIADVVSSSTQLKSDLSVAQTNPAAKFFKMKPRLTTSDSSQKAI